VGIWREEIHKNEKCVLSFKSKNVEISYFYAFWFSMLEDKGLKFASRQLKDGIGSSPGFGTLGSETPATKRKKESSRSCVD